MSLTLSDVILILAVAWPLLVATLLVLPGMRPVGRVLTPWTALPALVLSTLPADTLRLPAVMLGAGLELDGTGRVFLILIASLWLASGILLRDRLRAASSNLFATMLLLAMLGSFSLVLSDNALLFFAASTVAGYSLYGALVHDTDSQTRTAGKVLVVLLVLSDLLVFEVLLLLGQAAGTTDFVSLRQVFVDLENANLVLGLLIIGFGVKLGILGVHFWVPPVFSRAEPGLLPALVAFMFGAGLLGGLRLIPLGQIEATGAASSLQWLAWVTLAYAGFAGMGQVLRRSVLGYATIVLGSLWLVVLSACLQQPALWKALAYPSAAALVQSGAALTAILLIHKANNPVSSRLRSMLTGLAVLLLAMSPLGLVSVVSGQLPIVSILSTMAVIALLAGRTFFLEDTNPLAGSVDRNGRSAEGAASYPIKTPPIPVWVIAALITVAMLVAGYQFLHVAPGEVVTGFLIVLTALLMVVLNARWRILRLPAFAPGDVLVYSINGLVLVRNGAGRLLADCLERWSDIVQALDRHIRPLATISDIAGLVESVLLRWSVALSLLLLLGLLVAWLALT
ncbi:MAG: proton-conducting transporter membrane subunit [Sedimenticola sp.]|nr:proton-conducting transporter membrane subunit [Sedimenticola sp.]